MKKISIVGKDYHTEEQPHSEALGAIAIERNRK